MFYNGATKDAKWRIGWGSFNRGLSRIMARCGVPLAATAQNLRKIATLLPMPVTAMAG